MELTELHDSSTHKRAFSKNESKKMGQMPLNNGKYKQI